MKVLVVILISSNILLVGMVINQTQYIGELERVLKEEYEPRESFNVTIMEYSYIFAVDKEFPVSRLTILGSVNRTIPLRTEFNHDFGVLPSDTIIWEILNYTIVILDWTREYWNGTTWIEEYAWDVEYTDWIPLYEGRPMPVYSSEFGINLRCDI